METEAGEECNPHEVVAMYLQGQAIVCTSQPASKCVSKASELTQTSETEIVLN